MARLASFSSADSANNSSDGPQPTGLGPGLHELATLDGAGLRQRWRSLIGGSMSAGLGRDLILRILAFQQQVQRYGDLDRASRQTLAELYSGRNSAVIKPINEEPKQREGAYTQSSRSPPPAPWHAAHPRAWRRVAPGDRDGRRLRLERPDLRQLEHSGLCYHRHTLERASLLRSPESAKPQGAGLLVASRQDFDPLVGRRPTRGFAAMTQAQVRCAIYTRVSSDQGLEQDFNSLDAQREAAEAYIKSQAHEGWRLHRGHYDDGGFSGGSMERPALRKLLADLADGRIDVVVVYKVDRLTRSLADFAKLVEIFDAHKASFVSVTQSFNTTSSMGRLTLNVLLSFAQFEREVTGERIRDKIAASKKKGIWMGGVVPLGYRVKARKLVVDETEAETVRLIYRRYLELRSLPALQRELRAQQIKTRLRVLSSGRTIGGGALTNGPLAYLLRNRLYLGELNHRGASYPSDHPAIVGRDLFDAVQATIAANRNRQDNRKTKSGALLMGRIVDDRGRPMSPAHTTKNGIRYRYYVASALVQGRSGEAVHMRRLSAPEVETIVLDAVRQRLPSRSGTGTDVDLVEHIDLRVTAQRGGLEISWIDRGVSAVRSSDAEAPDEPSATASRYPMCPSPISADARSSCRSIRPDTLGRSKQTSRAGSFTP